MRRSARLDDGLASLAYHEAAHAVLAERLAPGSLVRIDFTVIRNGQKGLVTWREAHNERTNALIAIAGDIGAAVWAEKMRRRRRLQRLKGGRTSAPVTAGPSRSAGDAIAVSDYVRSSGARTAKQRIEARRKLVREARRHVLAHWPEIDRLARALLARKAPFTMRRAAILRAMRARARRNVRTSYRSERRTKQFINAGVDAPA